MIAINNINIHTSRATGMKLESIETIRNWTVNKKQEKINKNSVNVFSEHKTQTAIHNIGKGNRESIK